MVKFVWVKMLELLNEMLANLGAGTPSPLQFAQSLLKGLCRNDYLSRSQFFYWTVFYFHDMIPGSDF